MGNRHQKGSAGLLAGKPSPHYSPGVGAVVTNDLCINESLHIQTIISVKSRLVKTLVNTIILCNTFSENIIIYKQSGTKSKQVIKKNNFITLFSSSPESVKMCDCFFRSFEMCAVLHSQGQNLNRLSKK